MYLLNSYKIFLGALCISMIILTACSAVSNIDNQIPISNENCIVFEGEVFYTVVRSDTSSRAVTDAAVTLRKHIQNAADNEVKIVTDWFKNNEKIDDVRGEFEILVGLTNRPESIAAYEKFKSFESPLEYMIEKSGNHYIIIANDEMISQAVEEFIKNITIYNEGSTLKVTDDISIYMTKQFPVSLLTIDNVNIKDFKIVYPSNYNEFQRELAANIQEYIYIATGFNIDIISDRDSGSEHEIIIGTSRGASYNNLNELDCVIEILDGNIYIGGKNYYADAKAVNYLINDFLYYNMYGKNPTEINLTSSDSKTYNSKPYNYDLIA